MVQFKHINVNNNNEKLTPTVQSGRQTFISPLVFNHFKSLVNNKLYYFFKPPDNNLIN